MLTRIAAAALAAALVAGLVVAVLQEGTTTPLIIAAEQYEGGGGEIAASTAAVDPESDAWAPDDGMARTFYTSITAIGTSFGFALVLLGVMILANARITARTGLMWGLAAFAATGLAPALGLSPELPGSAAADLSARQVWWAGTAIATAAGLFLIFRISTALAIGAGVIFIVAPHVIGAPHPSAFTSAVPSELSGHFAAASLVVQAVAWSLAGAVAGYVWQRMGNEQEEAALA